MTSGAPRAASKGPDPRRLLGARLLIVGGVLMGWLSLMRVLQVEGLPHPRGPALWVDLSFLASLPVVALATVLFLVCLGLFVARRGVPWACAGAASLLALGSFVQLCQWPGDAGANHGVGLPGALMVAIAVAYVLTPDAARRESLGYEAAAGVVAGGYSIAALSKVYTSGLDWGLGSNLALHIASHAQVGAGPVAALRLAVAREAWLCGALGLATIALEGSFVFFVVRRLRPALAMLACGMHFSISVVMGLHHYDWLLCVVGVALAASAYPGGEGKAA